MPILPTGLAIAALPRDHLFHHEAIHASIGGGLDTSLVPQQPGHLPTDHETIHAALGLGLPTDIVTWTDEEHIAWHNTIHAAIVPGPRGAVGQRDPANVPGFPQTGLVTVAPGATTIQDAIAANPADTKFLLQAGTFLPNSELQPKAGQQFWAELGAIISGNGVRERGFVDLGGRNGVKIMNVKMSGFTGGTYNNRTAIWQPRPGASSGWEIGYCEVSGDTVNARYGIANGTGNTWIHHCKIHDFAEGPIVGFDSTDALTEDCEVYNGGGLNGQKWLGQLRHTVRHCRFHDMNGTSIWHDAFNNDCLIEWNLVEGGLRNGIEFEISGEQPGTLNVVRYNHVRNHGETGMFMSVAARTEVYRNIFETNGLDLFPGNAAEIQMFVKQSTLSEGVFDLFDNYAHDNTVIGRTDGVNAKAGQMNWSAGDAPTDPAPYLDNTKNNRWRRNTYDILDVSAGQHFRWGVDNITWATWLTKPTPEGTQDMDSTAT